MRKIYLLTLSSFLLAETLPPAQSPLNLGYETQKQTKQTKEQITSLQKKLSTIEKIEIEKKKEQIEQTNLGPNFTLNGVSIKGNTTFKQEEIILFVKPYVGKKVYTKTLQEIAQKITALYYSKGYVTSKCVLPQQNVKNGNVLFQIIEDKLGAIALSGENAHNYNTKIFLKHFKELQGKIINADELNEKLRLLKYLPISKISPTLSKVRPGVSNLILKISESKQRISLNVNNMGSQYSGLYRTTLTGNINNIAGISDSLSLSFTTTQMPHNYSSLSASYRHPIGDNGAKILWAISQLNYQLDPDEIGTDTVFYDGDSSAFTLQIQKPIFLFDRVNIWLSAGFDYKDLTSKTIQNNNGDILVNSVDKTSVITLGTNIDFVDEFKGYNALSLKIAQAIPNLFNSMSQEDIDRKTYRIENEDDFASLAKKGPVKYGDNLSANFNKIYFSASRQQYLPKEFTMNFSFSGQYTSRRIPQAYEYSTGDYGFGASTGIYHNLMTTFLQLGVTYSYTRVYEYDLNLDLDTLYNRSSGVTLNIFYEDFYTTLSYASSLEEWDSSTENIKFSLGYSW
ncbi:MAG: POTRA domain-containing protein [Campylobacterota bacterium]|nr:POTRA domain-containing protein [Campylobacterota bacterium]